MSAHYPKLHGAELRGLSSDELERQADIWIYGHPVYEGANEREIFRWPYVPVALPILYRNPRIASNWGVPLSCRDCGRPRSRFSAERCRACYRQRAKDRFMETVDGMDYLQKQTRGVALPDTPFFDESDIPAVSVGTRRVMREAMRGTLR